MDWGRHISEISSKATKTLGFLRRNLAFTPKSTKEVAYKTLVWPKLEYAAPIWSPFSKLQINQVEKVQRTAARWTCRRWRKTSSLGEMLDELEWPSLEACRDWSPLLLFHKIHSGAVSIEKDKYLTPAHSLKSTRSSHSAQYCRYQTNSDALKNSFFPNYATVEWSFSIRWSISRLLRSLGHSSFSQKHSRKVVFSFKSSKFALPGVMIVFDRASRNRYIKPRRQVFLRQGPCQPSHLQVEGHNYQVFT